MKNSMEKWCWIELIGFDKDSPDYAVGEFIRRIGEKPNGVSFLMMDVGFTLLHKSDRPYTLRPIDCVYGNKDCNEDRERQAWNSTDLMGLIARLHEEGIKVYLSFFNMLGEESIDGVDFKAIREYDRDGNCGSMISMIKSFENGTSFADYFLPKLREVVEFYGFDGVQFADGASCARRTVELGDFTDDVAGRFAKEYPLANLPTTCKTTEEYIARRDAILNNYRYEYCKYLTTRWAAFYRRVHEVLAGISLMFNSFWTRDPFEALYRYGIDYRTCLAEGDLLMVEEVSASFTILAQEDQCAMVRTQEERKGYHSQFHLMQMALKSYLPTTKQITLTPIKDTTEQWDIIRQAPMELTKAIYRRNNGYVLQKGELERYSGGRLYCLCDGVPKENWDYVSRLESTAFEKPQAPYGATLLWSDGRLDEELKLLCRERRYSSTELYNRLVNNGLTVSTMARADELAGLQSPVIVANPDTLSAAEKAAVEGYAAPLLTVGYGKLEKSPAWIYEKEGFICALYNVAVDETEGATFCELVKDCAFALSPSRDEVFGVWVGKLTYNCLPASFFQALTTLVNKTMGFPYTDERRLCSISGFQKGNKRYLLLHSEEYFYVVPRIYINEKILSVKSLTKIDGYKVRFSGNWFIDRIPPRGMDILEITVED